MSFLAFALASGLSQGILPLIGYNYSAKSFKRMQEAIWVTLVMCLTIICAATLFKNSDFVVTSHKTPDFR